MKALSFLSKPADLAFLLRISVYGLVTAVSAYVARFTTEILLRTQIAVEANPFFNLLGPIHSTVQSSTLGILFASAVVYPMLFLWGQPRPKFKKWAEAIAIIGMLIVFFDGQRSYVFALKH